MMGYDDGLEILDLVFNSFSIFLSPYLCEAREILNLGFSSASHFVV